METTPNVRYFIGLDLGPVGLFTGLAVVEQRGEMGRHGHMKDTTYAVRHLQRFPPGAPLNDWIESVTHIVKELPKPTPTVVVDKTAVGKAVFERIRGSIKQATVRGVSITGGSGDHTDAQGNMFVAKVDLAGLLQVLLQERRLKVSPTLEHASTLVEELQQFQIRNVSLAQTSLLEWRDRPHDDLVLAVAIAVWMAERRPSVFVAFI